MKIIKSHFICHFILFLLLLCILSGCVYDSGSETIRLNAGQDGFAAAVARLFPDHSIISDGFILEPICNGAVIEAYDAQIQAAAGQDRYWLPLTLETVVIAVDRNRTAARINSWSDLPVCGAEVNINNINPFTRPLIAAMCYGLEGENFTLKGSAAIKYLAGMYGDGRLKFKDATAPVQICFDSEAVAKKVDNPHIEIIVPAEGTLSFVRGLFSTSPLELPQGADDILLGLGLRLPGGRCENSLYPDTAAYGSAKLLPDYTNMNKIMQDLSVLRREVQHVRLYTSADGREHVLFALVYIILAVIWTGTLMRRALQKDVGQCLLIAGIMLIAWMTLRIIKYASLGESVMTRYIWYMYYFFHIALPLVMLRITALVGAGKNRPRVPLPYKYACGLNTVMLLLIMTNDLHKWMFKIDLTQTMWEENYTYGFLYFIVMGVIFAELIASVAMLFIKAKDSPRRMGAVFPLIFIATLMVYAGGYAAGIQFFAESDLTMVIGLFSLLFLELCIRAGQIPVNSAYRRYFRLTSNKLRIVDNSGAVVISSNNAPSLCAAEWEQLRSGGMATADENILLFAKEISGGHAVWQEDISSVNSLKKQIEAANHQLEDANSLLAKEEQIKGKAAESKARKKLYEELERDLSRHQRRLAAMLGSLPHEEAGRWPRMTAVTLRICYIKRKCQLLFMEMSGQETVASHEFAVYADELAEIALLGGLNCPALYGSRGGLPMRRASLFYDFLDTVLEYAVNERFTDALVHMLCENERTALKIMLPRKAIKYKMDEELIKTAAAAGGILEINDLDITAGLSLSFPEVPGGESDA